MKIDIYHPVKTQKIPEKIVEQIKALIKEGKIQPGEQLPPERAFAEMLGVGRPTLREALNHLEATGYLEIRKRRGVFVKNIGSPLVSEPLRQIFREDQGMFPYLYEMRKDIELASAELAAKRRTDEDLHAILAPIERMQSDLRENRLSIMDDIAFHIAVARATHNFLRVHILKEIFDISNEFLNNVMKRLGRTPSNYPEVVSQHRLIFDAISRRDTKGAREKIEKHLRWVEDQWQQILIGEPPASDRR
jgi:GntR family transcriptional repressor for pyruvate dehydrogenase complex